MSIVIGNKTVAGIHIANKEVQRITIGGKVAYEKEPDYFRIVNEYAGSNTISLTKAGTPTDITLDYSTDNGSTWTTWSSANGNLSVTLAQGGKVMFKGDNPIATTSSNYFYFSGTQNHSISGDFVYLYDSTASSSIVPSNAFDKLFYEDTKLIDAKNSYFSVTDFDNYSMSETFKNCSNLQTAPNIEVNTVGTATFNSTFEGCTSLTDVSRVYLNATNVPTRAYKIMFKDTAITTAPEIMATSIYSETTDRSNGSLSYMFQNCSSLRTIKVHFANWNDGAGTHYWCNGVAATGDFYNLGGATISTGRNGIPSGWTEHTTL